MNTTLKTLLATAATLASMAASAQHFAPVDTRTMAVGIRLKNGRTRRQEVPFGSSFYSQSARGVWLLPGETVTKRYLF